MSLTSNHTSRKRHLLLHVAGIAAVTLTAGAAWKVTTVLRTRVLGLQDDLQVVTELVGKDREVRSRHEQLSKEILSLHSAAASRTAAIDNGPNDASLLAELSKLANAVDLSIKSYSPGQASSLNLEAQISATASYAGVCKFLNALSDTSFLCEVTQCSIAAPPQDGGPCALELTVRVVRPNQIHSTLAAGDKQ